MSHRHDNPCGQDSPQLLQVDQDVSGRASNCPDTVSEPPKRPPGLQSPAVRGGSLKPVPLVHLSLPPPSKAKSPESSGPAEISIVGPETVTITLDTPEPPISPITSSSVKLPPVQERLQPSGLPPTLKESSAPMQSNAATEETRNSSTSRKDEMCRKWFTGSCVRKWCPYAHKIIPSNLTCNLWLLAKCTRKQCPFVHERQGSDGPAKNQPLVQNDGTQEVVDRDLTQPASSGTSRSTDSTTPVPPATKSRDTRRPSQVASNHSLSECAERKAPSKNKLKSNTPTSSSPTIVRNTHANVAPAPRNPQTAPQRKQVCRDWLRGRCMRSLCHYLHEHPPNDNTLKTNTPTSSSSSSPTIVRNADADDAPAPRNPHPAQKPIPSNSLTQWFTGGNVVLVIDESTTLSRRSSLS